MTYIVTISTSQGGNGKVKGNILPTEGAALLDKLFTLQGQDFYPMTAIEIAIAGFDPSTAFTTVTNHILC